MLSRLRVAVLGAGITGSCTALQLARKGCSVTLIDKGEQAMTGASRWNEGKIHLGFLYAADPSGATAGALLQGGIAFRPLVEDLIGSALRDAVTPEPDVYLVHPDSVVDAADMESYFGLVQRLLAEYTASSYLAPTIRVERLDRRTLSAVANECVAGFRVPERSIRTAWLADRLVEAIQAEKGIQLLTRTTVAGVVPSEGSWHGPWTLKCQPEIKGKFDVVINALWENLLVIDLSAGWTPEREWSHRYRLALFAETVRPVDLPSMVLATGPFGDVKNYDGRHLYLSWYQAGLVASAEMTDPPDLPIIQSETVIGATVAGLKRFLPCISDAWHSVSEIKVAGGWVFAFGKGSLADPTASIHRRDRFGIRRCGNYVSVNTGKYSMGPWLARQIANGIIESA
jgi:glycine/D-amino acid oxidase-like deaminating enzyme